MGKSRGTAVCWMVAYSKCTWYDLEGICMSALAGKTCSPCLMDKHDGLSTSRLRFFRENDLDRVAV